MDNQNDQLIITENNVLILIEVVRCAMKDAGWEKDKIVEVWCEMLSSDYVDILRIARDVCDMLDVTENDVG